MKKNPLRVMLPLSLSLALWGCSADTKPLPPKEKEKKAAAENQGVVALTPAQIATAGIEVTRPTAGGAGELTLPATIEGDPQALQAVSAAIGGRVVALHYNLGQTVRRGATLALIESREAAALRAEVEAAEARATLARSELAREERLLRLKVSPERDLLAARNAMTEANIALRLARQQLAAAGAGGGALNRIAIVAPISGQIVSRSAVLGQTVAADAELFRVANLSRVAVRLSLTTQDAGKVSIGMPLEISAGNRRARTNLSFLSPVLDESTRLVSAVAILDNRSGLWRPGENISAALPIGPAGGTVRIDESALQQIEGRTMVFARIPQGFRALPVRLVSRGGGSAVVEGLSTGEEIATKGSFVLKAELRKGEAGHGGH
ncbi:efflux RND transporter periplasmic adaptor subunit [Sphingopyxis sp. MWB1]|uniref:efflux RND transporter periplasmic adaptor subunit n=1 Tax=Sphingopyxis sp. MWB1 TaxID=1537715 RepID=UPI00051A6DBD|nr:efflux RND transporter periplasmic adaptor subunit [Sphingopyxis sp. MWB1]